MRYPMILSLVSMIAATAPAQTIPGMPVAPEELCGQALVTWQEIVAGETLPLHATSEAATPYKPEKDLLTGEVEFERTQAAGPGCPSGTSATTPALGLRFPAASGPGGAVFPPDTMGAIGPRHFVELINNFGGHSVLIYDRFSGRRVAGASWQRFFGAVNPSGVFDPRILFDQHSQRWIIAAAQCFGCNSGVTLVAISTSDDPTGGWFQFCLAAEGFPDFPTLGVSADGVFVAATLFNGPGPTLWAIEKAPLLEYPPRIGAITRFDAPPPGVTWYPAHTFGDSSSQYLLRLEFPPPPSAPVMRFFELRAPIASPSLRVVGTVALGVEDCRNLPEPRAAGCLTGINTLSRPANVVYRDGSLWTCRVPCESGRKQCRWYEFAISPQSVSLAQCGSVSSATRDYYYPSIAVNSAGDAVMAFSGSSASEFIGSFYVGRRASDGPGQVSAPAPLKGGEATFCPPGVGSLRWGDYSNTSVDPVDETTFWTIQQYAGVQSEADRWGLWVGQLSFDGFDCNSNGTPDADDLAAGASDCNSNGVPDACEPDCNSNGVADGCDLDSGFSRDCNENGTPDECEGYTPPPTLIVGGWSVNPHAGVGPREIAVNVAGRVQDANVTTEPRSAGVTEFHVIFDMPPPVPSQGSVIAVDSQTGCPPGTPAAYAPDPNAAASSVFRQGTDLLVEFRPFPPDNGRTVRLTFAECMSAFGSQTVEFRVLKSDSTSDGRVNGTDRSAVIGAWTGPRFSPETDINLDGHTDALDRSEVIGIWTGAGIRCAP